MLKYGYPMRNLTITLNYAKKLAKTSSRMLKAFDIDLNFFMI